MGRASQKKKKRRQKAAVPTQARALIHTPTKGAFWHKLLTPLGLLVSTVGFVGAVIGIGLAARDAWRAPEIHASPGEYENPFELRFSLYNPSTLFRMSEMRFTCELPQVLLGNENYFGGGQMNQTKLIASLEPGHTIEYRCPFNSSFYLGPTPYLYAVAQIKVDFKTLWKKRETTSEAFTWSASTKRWIEGAWVN